MSLITPTIHSPVRRRAAWLLAAAIASLAVWSLVPGAGAAAAAGDSGRQQAFSDEEIYMLTCGHLGVPCQSARPKLRLKLDVDRLAVPTRARVRARVTLTRLGRTRTVRSAVIRVGGRTMRTDRHGRAVTTLRVDRRERLRAVARKAGTRTATATIRVR